MVRFKIVWIFLVIITSLSGCSSTKYEQPTVVNEPVQSVTSAELTPSDPNTVVENGFISVSKEEFGDEWPVTVDSGKLECIDGYDIVLHANDETYALNGNARSKADHGKYKDVEEIWADNPEIPGTKKNIGVLITPAADKLCSF